MATFEESIPERPLLSAPMEILFLLTRVHYPIPVEGGRGGVFPCYDPNEESVGVLWQLGYKS